MNNLLPGEAVVFEKKAAQLTNIRFRAYKESDFGSVRLDQIDCVKVEYFELFVLIVISVLAIIGAIFQFNSQSPNNEILVLELVVAIGSLVGYFFTRTHKINVITKSGTTISLTTRGFSRDEVRDLVDKLEGEIEKRKSGS